MLFPVTATPVIEYGTQAQAEFRHKTFRVFKETASVFIPDGTLTDYVLESYERGYLSVLMAASYLHMRQLDDAKVELRRLDHEIFTTLYNYGEDPVNVLLSAVLWEQASEPAEVEIAVGPMDAEPEPRARLVLEAGEERELEIEVPPPSFRVVVTIRPTFTAPDGRQLGARLGFVYRSGQ